MSLLLLAALASAAQTTPAAEAPAAPVKVYDAAFFADFKPETAFDMVRRVPAFNMDSGTAQRGFSGADSNVRIDGQLPASRDSIDVILRRIPAAAVARIEIVSGSVPGIDLQGRPVVANVVRKPDEGLKGNAAAAIGLFENGRGVGRLELQAEKRAGARSMEGAVFYNHAIDHGEGDRLRGLSLNQSAAYHYRSTTDVGTMSGAVEQPVGQGRLRLSAMAGTQVSPNTRRVDGASPSIEDTGVDRVFGEASARYSRNLAGGGNVQVTAFQQMADIAIRQDFAQGANSTIFTVDTQTGESILRASGRTARMGDWSFDGGAEADFNWLKTQNTYTVNGAAVVLPAARVRVEEKRAELQAAATWTPAASLNLQFGLRYEASDISSTGAVVLDKTLTYLKPRVVATWTPVKGRTLILRAERLVDQLSFNDFSATASLTNGTVVAGNPDLEPAISTLYEVRFEQRFAGRGALVLQANHRDIENVVGRNIFTTALGSYEAPDNIGPAWRNTASVNLTVPLDRVGLKGGLLKGGIIWRDSEVTDPLTHQLRGLSNEAPFDYSVALSQDVPGSKFSWSLEASKVARTVTWQSSEISTVVRSHFINAAVDYRIKPRLSLRVEALNLLDADYRGTREIYSGPRGTGTLINRERVYLGTIGGGRGLRVTLRRTF